ncbi:hypothetical protein IE81DRAFT_155665 [Ceraceosorus guamensis]|uniref:Uncharacterized protein n=1 Tax=Ceraceosorus guamensis TaxID=1522189 RepID=A0A316VWK9_9BASI|nr:hypothetical protein IE81DRAFT_155665 [Ceraceosorus guamensis]PWN41829.1 hypothetical protein IE81DRAFT_155665 [Ceraceosorus guamensis]
MQPLPIIIVGLSAKAQLRLPAVQIERHHFQDRLFDASTCHFARHGPHLQAFRICARFQKRQCSIAEQHPRGKQESRCRLAAPGSRANLPCPEERTLPFVRSASIADRLPRSFDRRNLSETPATLFAWPFNLDPDGTSDSGKVFITPRSPDVADAPQPHLISESLKLVGVVLGNWMQNRSRFDVQTRIASTAPEGSTSPSGEEDGEVARLRRDLGLIRLTCEERAAALARQEIPASAWRRPSCCSCAEAPDSPRRVAFDESSKSRPRESALGLRFDDGETLELVNSRRHSIEPHRLRKSVSFDEKRNTTLTFEKLPKDKATPLMRVKDALSFPSTAPFFKRDLSVLSETSTDDLRRSVPASPASPSSVSPSLSEFSWSPKHRRSSLASPISSIGSCSELSSSSGNFAVSPMSPLARPQSPTHIEDGHDLLTFSTASRRLSTEDVDLCIVATLPYKASSTKCVHAKALLREEQHITRALRHSLTLSKMASDRGVENASTAVLSSALLHSAELARCKEISTSLAASPMPVSPTRGRTLQARASSASLRPSSVTSRA